MQEKKQSDRRTDAFQVTGLTCADCAAKLEERLRALEGIEDVALNFMAARLTVRHRLAPDAIIRAVAAAGYGALPEQGRVTVTRRGFLKTHHRAFTTLISALLLTLAWGVSGIFPVHYRILLYIAAILTGGLWTLRRGIISLRYGSFDMNALMTIAVIGAGILGDWNEAASIAVLYSVSNMLESYTMEKTRQSIRGLMEIAPREARVRRGDRMEQLPVESIQIGDTVVIKPGEKVAVDGVILHGASAINQSAITGESLPVEKSAGDEVFAGTLNTTGALDVRVTKNAGDSALARIIHLVEEAQARRAPSQTFVDRFARVYTPLVLLLAVGIALVPPLLLQAAWGSWIYRALTLIVVACPCALVISTPVAIVSAIGNAARHGVLIKGGAYLEELGRMAVVAFDKTGTLTLGHPVVTDVVAVNGLPGTQVLALAAAVEARSSHVLADAIVRKAHDERIELPTAVADAVSLPGRGARAAVAGTAVLVGNRRYFTEEAIDTTAVDGLLDALEAEGKTAMLVATGGEVAGIIAAADRPRPRAKQVVAQLHRAGIHRVVLLTGDHQETASRIAAQMGIDDVRADLLPEDKALAMRDLQADHGVVGMVGDGINDAPALAAATVGVAMGVAGSDTALETADIALMADDLEKLPYAVRLSRKTLAIIRQNILIALGIKALAIALIFPGWLTLWMAVLADMGASIVVTMNGLRLVRGERAEQQPQHVVRRHGCADGCCDDCAA